MIMAGGHSMNGDVSNDKKMEGKNTEKWREQAWERKTQEKERQKTRRGSRCEE